jgi:uncharacterized lipoprotein YmbA
MKKLVAAAAILLLTGCASVPVKQSHQINRAAKADKYAKQAKAEQPATTPNEIVKKRWYDRFLKHKSAK